MKDLINTQIKELYKNKASFCEENGYKYKDFASKLRTVETKDNWLNEFLKPLKLCVKITLVDE
jgi:hypothetical protein